MEKIGLINKLGQNIEQSWDTHLLFNETHEAKKHNLVLAETVSILKDIKASKDLNLALGGEEMLLRQELAAYANSPEQHNSVNAAIKQIQEARKSLVVVNDPKAYQAATETYSGKRKEAGLPIDSFREFLKSHNTRLTNLMKSELSVPKKNILRQRKEILGMVKEVYMGMQREALDLPPQEKSRGLGR